MKQNVTIYGFKRAFQDARREDQFTYYGFQALYDYLLELEDDIGEEIELDVVAISCDYAEYTLDELWEEYATMYEFDVDDKHDDLTAVQELIDCLMDDTVVIKVTNLSGVLFGVIVQVF